MEISWELGNLTVVVIYQQESGTMKWQNKGGADNLLIANYKGELVTVADKLTLEVAQDIFTAWLYPAGFLQVITKS